MYGAGRSDLRIWFGRNGRFVPTLDASLPFHPEKIATETVEARVNKNATVADCSAILFAAKARSLVQLEEFRFIYYWTNSLRLILENG